MRRARHPAHHRSVSGFSLIELMIVLVIMAIITAIAYPAYRNQIRETRRSDGKIALTTAAQQLERCFTRNGAYDEPADCAVLAADDTLSAGFATSSEGNYSLTVNTTATTYTLTATPTGALARMGDPDCRKLSLNQQGQRGASGPAGADACW